MLVNKKEFAKLRTAFRKALGLEIINPKATNLEWNYTKKINGKALVTVETFGMDESQMAEILGRF